MYIFEIYIYRCIYIKCMLEDIFSTYRINEKVGHTQYIFRTTVSISNTHGRYVIYIIMIFSEHSYNLHFNFKKLFSV